MRTLPKQQYWEKLTEYFYDHIHWTSGKDKYAGMIEWLAKDYRAEASYYSSEIKFSNDRDATFFIMRWAQ
jgi:hypothetical protein